MHVKFSTLPVRLENHNDPVTDLAANRQQARIPKFSKVIYINKEIKTAQNYKYSMNETEI